MTEELIFPLEFKKCPSCGGTKRVFETIVKQEQAKGKLAENARSSSRPLIPLVIGDPTKLVLSMPAVLVSYDICVDCGTEYCVRVDMTTATPGIRSTSGGGMKGYGSPQGDPRLS